MSAVIILNSSKKKLFPINTSEITIGRSSNNNIVIDDPKVSQKHARIVKKPKGYYLEDLGSSNGTFFQGRNIQLVHLRTDDVFNIGNTQLRFLEDDKTVLDSHGMIHADPYRYGKSDIGSALPPVIKEKKKSWIPWAAGGGVLLIAALMVFLVVPMYGVETGTVVTCKECGKEISNDVRYFNVNFLDKDNPKYIITRNQDYCSACGSQPIPFAEHYYCEFCGKEYKTFHKNAPRREEKGDQNITLGYCDNICAAGRKVEKLGEKTEEMIEKFTNPLEMLK